MNLQELLSDPPKVHEWTPNEVTASGLPNDTFGFLDGLLKPGMRTMETGMGISTALFAMKGCEHVCINPEAQEKERLLNYCTQHAIGTESVRFVLKTSDQAISDPDCAGEFDLLLIDGGHGFPVPMIDFYFYASRLRKSGYLLLDDTQLWSVRILVDFLRSDAAWEHVPGYSDKTAIFKRKVVEPLGKEWCFQPYVIERTRELEALQAKGRPSPGLLSRVRAVFSGN